MQREHNAMSRGQRPREQRRQEASADRDSSRGLRAGLSARFCSRRLVRSVVVGVLAVVGFGLVPAGASAESLCTDSWTGPAEGEWGEAARWSALHFPTSSDVACIGAGKTVKVLSGAGVAAVVQGAGSLVVQGRFVSLEVTSALEPSAIANLSIEEEGVVTGGAEVQVTN